MAGVAIADVASRGSDAGALKLRMDAAASRLPATQGVLRRIQHRPCGPAIRPAHAVELGNS